MDETTVCSSEDIDVKEAVPTSLDFRRKVAVGKEEIVGFLEQFPYDSRNEMRDTESFFSAIFEKDVVFDKLCM